MWEDDGNSVPGRGVSKCEDPEEGRILESVRGKAAGGWSGWTWKGASKGAEAARRVYREGGDRRVYREGGGPVFLLKSSLWLLCGELTVGDSVGAGGQGRERWEVMVAIPGGADGWVGHAIGRLLVRSGEEKVGWVFPRSHLWHLWGDGGGRSLAVSNPPSS